VLTRRAGSADEWKPRDGWAPICSGLGLPVPDDTFPHVNTTDEFRAMAEPRQITGVIRPVVNSPKPRRVWYLKLEKGLGSSSSKRARSLIPRQMSMRSVRTATRSGTELRRSPSVRRPPGRSRVTSRLGGGGVVLVEAELGGAHG